MSTLHRYGTLALCAVFALSAALAAPRTAAATEVTVSLGALSLSWPKDAGALYRRLRRLTDEVCYSVSLLRLAEYERCASRLGHAHRAQSFITTTSPSAEKTPVEESYGPTAPTSSAAFVPFSSVVSAVTRSLNVV